MWKNSEVGFELNHHQTCETLFILIKQSPNFNHIRFSEKSNISSRTSHFSRFTLKTKFLSFSIQNKSI